MRINANNWTYHRNRPPNQNIYNKFFVMTNKDKVGTFNVVTSA